MVNQSIFAFEEMHNDVSDTQSDGDLEFGGVSNEGSADSSPLSSCVSTPSSTRAPSPADPDLQGPGQSASEDVLGRLKRKRAYDKDRRARKRAAHAAAPDTSPEIQDAFDYKPPEAPEPPEDAAETPSEHEVVPCRLSIFNFKRAQGAWITLRDDDDEPFGSSEKQLQDLLDAGLKLIPWDGK